MHLTLCIKWYYALQGCVLAIFFILSPGVFVLALWNMIGIRAKLKSKKSRSKAGFKFRGVDNTRIEALSDGVFAIAIGLLLLSSRNPETYADLEKFMVDFVPFGATISLLMVIWYQHYLFFIRYGLKDPLTVAVNTFLLFLLLFYVYPLKFLMQVLYKMITYAFTGDSRGFDDLFTTMLPLRDAPQLMIYYGMGAVLIFMTISALYMIALMKKSSLNLTPQEEFETKSSMITNLLMAVPPTLSILITKLAPGNDAFAFSAAGLIYLTYPIIMIPYGFIMKRITENRFGNKS